MKLYSGILAAALLATLPAAAQIEKLPAFPGAEGYGRYTTGGRGGYVYHVTSLNDDGATGTLRWALSQPGPRTIVFDVSGTIFLTKALYISDNTTLAGQSAPGDGICLADYPVTIGSNTITRYMRFRLGNRQVAFHEGDGLGAMEQHDLIIDHCSVSWSIDECCSILGNVRSTLQWTLVAQSLVNSGHVKGAHGYGGNWGGTYASFHHNAIVHHSSRTPRLGPRPCTQENEIMDMRNNLIFNHGKLGCYGGEGMNVNIVKNYYRPGPSSGTGTYGQRIAGVGIRTTSYCAANPSFSPMLHKWGTYYLDGNQNHNYANVYADNWNNGFYNQISSSDNDGLYTAEAKAAMHLDEPIDFVLTTTHEADVAYQKILDYCGASLHRDWFDAKMMDNARTGNATATGKNCSQGYVNSQDDNKPYNAPADWSAWPTLETTELPLDTDRDGIPDEWELRHGLDPKNAADRNKLNWDGYTMLEVYLNEIVADITDAQNSDGELLGHAVYADPVKESYTLSVETNTGTADFWQFDGDISVTGGSSYAHSGSYLSTVTGQHTIVLPRGSEVYAIDITGKGSQSAVQMGVADGEEFVHITEINGETFPRGAKTLPGRKGTDTTVSHTLAEPARQVLTITFENNKPNLKEIILHTRVSTSAVDEIGADRPGASGFADADNAWYDLTGRLVRYGAAVANAESAESLGLAPGIYIHRGRKVVIR